MFKDCVNLTEVSDLPAKELANNCYEGMFAGCKKLVKGPIIEGKSLNEDCIKDMFYNCAKLNQIAVRFISWKGKNAKPAANNKAKSKTPVKRDYSSNWVSGVSKEGTFICPASLVAEFNENKIPKGWKVKRE